MALTQIGMSANLTWQLARAITGFADVTQGSDSASFSNSLDVTTWNTLFTAQNTIAAAGTQAVDLRTFTDFVGTSATADKAVSIIIIVAGAITDVLNVKTHGTNGLQWFFESTTNGVNIPGGGIQRQQPPSNK